MTDEPPPSAAVPSALDDRFRVYFEHAPHAVFLADEQGRYVEVNPAACRLTGYDEAELLRLSIPDLLPPEALNQGLEHFLCVRETGRSHGEMPYLGKGGRRGWWSVDAVKLSDTRYLGYVTDVTERNQNRERLEQSEAKLRAIFDSEPECVKLIDADGRLVEMNRAGLEMIEAESLDEARRTDLLELILPEYRDAYRADVEEAFRGGRTCLEFEIVGLRGTHRWMEQRTVGLPDPSDPRRMTHALSVTRDVTARKRAERALTDAHHQLRSVLDSLFGFVGLYTLDGTLIEANRAPLEAAGLTPEQVLGKPFWETYWWSYSPAVQARLRDALQRAAQGELVRYETDVRIKDGALITIDVMFGPLRNADGAIVNIIGFAVDVTERKRVEDRLRLHSQVLLSMTEAVCFVDAEGIIRFTNTALDDMYGYEPGELVGRPVVELNDYTPEENRRVVAEIMTVMETDGVWSGEFRNRRKDGAVFWTAARIFSVRYQDARRFVSIQQDVTEKKRGEEQTALLRSQLAHAGRVAVIGEMASGLAHELNQPLAALQLYVGSALDVAARLDSPPLNRHLQRIGEQAVRASEIVRGMRSFAKRDPAQRTAVDLNRLIREVLTLLQHELRKNEVTLQLNLDESLPPVWADALQIQQVLANLIRNAVDAMSGDDCPRRTLLLYSEVVPDGVGVGVVDSGCGVHPDMAGKLFQPFQTDKPSGLGLGLAISRTLVEAHGGRIEARADPTGGSTFYFVLPVSEPPSSV